MSETQQLEDIFIPAVNDTDRITRHDVPDVTKDDEVVAVAEGTRYRGPVDRVDHYGDTTDVERDIQFRLKEGHEPDDGWELWRAYIVEEPAGVYRMGAQEDQIDGPGKWTIYLDAPTEITVR